MLHRHPSRRSFLAAAVGGTSTAVRRKAEPPFARASSEGTPPAGLTVTLRGLPAVEAPGGTLVFSQSDAADMGDYLGEFIHQKCYLQSKGFFNVFFRPDVDGLRQ